MNTTCKRSAISLPSQLPKLSFRVSRERVGAGAPPPQSSHGWACREVARRLPDSRMIDWYQYDVNAFTTQQIKWWQRSWWQSVPPVHRFAFYLQWNKAECKRIPSELHHALFIYQTLPSPRNPSVWNKPPPPSPYKLKRFQHLPNICWTFVEWMLGQCCEWKETVQKGFNTGSTFGLKFPQKFTARNWELTLAWQCAHELMPQILKWLFRYMVVSLHR